MNISYQIYHLDEISNILLTSANHQSKNLCLSTFPLLSAKYSYALPSIISENLN